MRSESPRTSADLQEKARLPYSTALEAAFGGSGEAAPGRRSQETLICWFNEREWESEQNF